MKRLLTAVSTNNLCQCVLHSVHKLLSTDNVTFSNNSMDMLNITVHQNM